MSKPHRDGANAGWSALVTMGSYTGGELLSWKQDTGGEVEAVMQSTCPEVLDASSVVFFDGRQLHATKAFLGTRYALVFFAVRGAENVPIELQRELVAMGASCKSWQVQAL